MSFHVDPAAIRTYARQLGEVERVAEDAGRYVAAHGNFGIHEAGIIGLLSPSHRSLMAELTQALEHLTALGVESQKALRATADAYEHTDQSSAAKVDASYPEVPRTSHFRD